MTHRRPTAAPEGPANSSSARAIRTATWIGLRVPIKLGFGPPTPGTVIIRTESLWTLARLLRLGPGLAVGAGALLLSLLFWLPLVGSITRSLTRLNRATERIAEGEFSTRVELSRRDEIGHLGHSVNRMAERLDTLVNGQKRFLGDVAHELGSPLGASRSPRKSSNPAPIPPCAPTSPTCAKRFSTWPPW